MNKNLFTHVLALSCVAEFYTVIVYVICILITQIPNCTFVNYSIGLVIKCWNPFMYILFALGIMQITYTFLNIRNTSILFLMGITIILLYNNCYILSNQWIMEIPKYFGFLWFLFNMFSDKSIEKAYNNVEKRNRPSLLKIVIFNHKYISCPIYNYVFENFRILPKEQND